MFPESNVAEGFSCGKSKTTAIVKFALKPILNGDVIKECQTSPFTLLCHEGNDQFGKKVFFYYVEGWDNTKWQLMTRFLTIPACNDLTAEALLMQYHLSLNLVIYHGKFDWVFIGYCKCLD